MNLHIENIGRIKTADIDIKPFTVFIGKANTNKTWTAYCLYGILRSLTRTRRSNVGAQIVASCAAIDDGVEVVTKQAAEFFRLAFAEQADLPPNEESKQGTNISLSIGREEILGKSRVGASTKFALNGDDLASILAVDSSIMKGSSATLDIPYEIYSGNIKLESLYFEWTDDFLRVTGIGTGGRKIYHFLAGTLSSESLDDALEDRLRPHVRWLAACLFEDAMAFPAERKGLSSIIPLFADAPHRENRVSSYMNVPSLDFVRFLSSAQRFQSHLKTQRGADFSGRSNRVVELIESRVMNGRADFEGAAEPKPFSFLADSGPPVQLHASASFVRSLAGLDVYLRTVPTHDIIVIDEPEMNAHPEAQIKLVEIFAILANQGRHVIVTTHSPYFVDHLNNLIQGANLSAAARERIAGELKLQDADALISVDKVAAYNFGEDGIVSSLIENGAINLESFSNETDYLANLYSDILALEE